MPQTSNLPLRVTSPFVQLEQSVLLKSSVYIPTQTVTVSDELIPASATIGGAAVTLNGNHTNYQWDTASNILESLRLQIASILGRPTATVPNGTYFIVTLLNKATDESTILVIDENLAAADNQVYYGDADSGTIEWAHASQFTLTIIEQKALGDSNDWIQAAMVDKD